MKYTLSDEFTFKPIMRMADLSGFKPNAYYRNNVKVIDKTAKFLASLLLGGAVIAPVALQSVEGGKEFGEFLVSGLASLSNPVELADKLGKMASFGANMTPFQWAAVATIVTGIVALKGYKKYSQQAGNEIYDDLKYVTNAYLLIDMIEYRNSDIMKEYTDFNSKLALSALSDKKFKKPTLPGFSLNSLLNPLKSVSELFNIVEFKSKLYENSDFKLEGKADDISFGEKDVDLAASAVSYLSLIRSGGNEFSRQVNTLLEEHYPSVANDADALIGDEWFQAEVMKKASGSIEPDQYLNMAIASMAGYENEIFNLPRGDIDTKNLNIESRLNDLKNSIFKEAARKSEVHAVLKVTSDDIYPMLEELSSLDYSNSDDLVRSKSLESELVGNLYKLQERYKGRELIDSSKIQSISNTIKNTMFMARQRKNSPDFEKAFSSLSLGGDLTVNSAKEFMDQVLVVVSKEKSIRYNSSSSDYLSDAVFDGFDEHLKAANVNEADCHIIKNNFSEKFTKNILNSQSESPEKLHKFERANEDRLNAVERKRSELERSSTGLDL